MLLFLDVGFDVSVFWGRCNGVIVAVDQDQGVFFVLFDHNFHSPDTLASTSTTPMKSNPEVRDQLSDDHTNCTGHETSNDTKEGWNDKKAQGLVKHVAEAMEAVKTVLMSLVSPHLMGVTMTAMTALAAGTTFAVAPAPCSRGACLCGLHNGL